MPSIVVNIVAGILGMGTVTTAIAVTMSLTSKNDSSLSSITPEMQRETHKPHSDWKELGDFRRYCYGDFLKEGGRRELLVCLDKSSKQSKSSPLFYLYWKEQETNHFWPMQKILVGIEEGEKWDINFYTEGQQRPKSLKVKKDDHKDLVVLQSNSSQELQDKCEDSHLKGEDYQLTCTFDSGSYKETYTKLAKKNWFED